MGRLYYRQMNRTYIKEKLQEYYKKERCDVSFTEGVNGIIVEVITDNMTYYKLFSTTGSRPLSPVKYLTLQHAAIADALKLYQEPDMDQLFDILNHCKEEQKCH